MGGSLELKAHDKSLPWAPKTIKTMKTMKHVGLGGGPMICDWLELHLSVSRASSILQPRWDFCAPGWVHPSCYQVPPRTTTWVRSKIGKKYTGVPFEGWFKRSFEILQIYSSDCASDFVNAVASWLWWVFNGCLFWCACDFAVVRSANIQIANDVINLDRECLPD